MELFRNPARTTVDGHMILHWDARTIAASPKVTLTLYISAADKAASP